MWNEMVLPPVGRYLITFFQPVQLVEYFAGRLVSLLFILLKALKNNAAQFGRDIVRSALERSRLAHQDGRDGIGSAITGKGFISADQFVEDRPQAEDIASEVEPFSAQLFRRHIDYGPNHQPIVRELARVLNRTAQFIF